MTFEYKYVTIKGKIFLIKFLTSIEERQLKNSNGRIAMSVFYFPNFPISMKESELSSCAAQKNVAGGAAHQHNASQSDR